MSRSTRAPAVRTGGTQSDHYTQILQRIISGEYPAGYRLVEDELAKVFDVSRTPIREVLVSLEKDGLVKRHPYRGARVADFTPDDVEEIYEIRSALECLALRDAIRNIPLSLLVDFERRLQQTLDQKSEHIAKDEYFGMDLELHRLIISHCRNKRLRAYMENLALLIGSLRIVAYYDDASVRRAGEEHLAIVKAVATRDLEAAESLLADHISLSKYTALKAFSSSREALK